MQFSMTTYWPMLKQLLNWQHVATVCVDYLSKAAQWWTH